MKIILGIVGVIAILAFIGSMSGDKSSTLVATTASTTTPPSAAIGDTAYLRASADPIMVPINQTAFDQTVKLSVAGDTAGLARMVVAGEIMTEHNGTRVKILDKNFTSTQVRIMSGNDTGESGWVPKEFVSAN